MLNVMLHGLNDHNGIVHHEADSQDESKQRECVDRKTQYWKDDKRSNKRDRNSQQRDKRGAPVLEEQEHNNNYKADRL